MFLRAHKSGHHTYLRLVESYRLHGQPRQRVVAHLGRQDLLAPHLDSLVRLLQAGQPEPRWLASEQVAAPQAWSWGPLRAARHLFDELALGPILDSVSATRRHGQPLSERVFVLLANRLTRPGSEHALAQWLEDFYVPTAAGSRWQPQWKQSRRVKVACEQLRLWYQTLDDLLAHKASIETAIWRQLRDLFSLAPELVFYDLTSTYFEGQGPAELGRFGYSRDSQPRKRQVLVGVVMMQGWPIAHHVFAGNRPDQATLLEVVEDLRSRFGLERVVWVGDCGMVTLGNLDELRQAGQGYLMGLQRRNRQDIADYIEEALARDGWQECEVGITASEKAQLPRTRVREVAGKRQGVRVFVVDSEERQQYEQARREQARERVREKLERLQQRVERGALKQPEKIGAAVAAILGRHHGHRYFQWELRQGEFHYAEHEVNFAREKLLEGKYVIQTEETDLTPLEAVAAYKELNEVERGFAQLKGLLEVRPVYHRRDEQVRAHVFVAALALLLDRALEKKLRAAGSGLSSAAAWRALETVRVVELELGERRKRCVTRGSRQAAEVLRVLGLSQQLAPPPPPAGQETIL